MTPEQFTEIKARNTWCSQHDPGNWMPVHQDRAALLAEVERLRALHAWRPIDTAPKTSPEWILLGYFPDYMKGKQQGGTPKIAYWSDHRRLWVDDAGRGLNADGAFSPTHWMPLPGPPKGQK